LIVTARTGAHVSVATEGGQQIDSDAEPFG